MRTNLVCATLFALSAATAACEACRPSTQGPATGATGRPTDPDRPTVRLYVVSDLAGALEPCGCVKDQKGGLDHAAAWIAEERKRAPDAAIVSAGPLFYMDPELKADNAAQDRAKAETLARVLGKLGLLAFAPGRNELAGGAPGLEALVRASGARMLAANVTGLPGAASTELREFQGVKVGFVGVTALDPPAALGAQVGPAEAAVKAGVATLKAQGANVLVLLAATGRGTAKRLADAVPELTAIVVGSPGGSGDRNTDGPPPERVGDTLVLETGNHLQTVGVLDLFVRDRKFTFADTTGVERAKQRDDVARRIDELRARIADWERDGRVAAADIAARKGDLAKLEAERAELEKAPPPATGSYLRFRSVEIREGMGQDPGTKAELSAYYKRVNDDNKARFKDRKPAKPAAGEPSYSGVEACTNCHDEPRAVWDKTAHARAYKTLADQSKEYNLDCVSCHVTGYDRPGGSTVTFVSDLENVQCEQCHGPGSLHVKEPKKVKVPVPKPAAESCAACHHPPHVHAFDAASKMDLVLGKGHGKK